MDTQTKNKRNEKIFFGIVVLIFVGMVFSGITMIFFPEFKKHVRPILNGIGILFGFGIGGLIVAAIVKAFIDSKNRGTVKIDIANGQIFEPGNLINVELGFEVPKPQRIERVTAKLICFTPIRHSSNQTAHNRPTRSVIYSAQTILAENFDVNPMRPWHKEFQIAIPEKVDESMRESNGISVDLSAAANALGNSFAGKAISALNPQISQAMSALKDNGSSFPGIEERSKVEKELKEGVPLIRVATMEDRTKGDIKWFIEVEFEGNNCPNASGQARVRIVSPQDAE